MQLPFRLLRTIRSISYLDRYFVHESIWSMESAPFDRNSRTGIHLLVPDPHQPLTVGFGVVTDQTTLLDRGVQISLTFSSLRRCCSEGTNSGRRALGSRPDETICR